MEVKLEEHCYQLIATGQPMAKDMRVIACTLKVITASMRIGRYGKVIANIVKEISDKPHIANLMSIPHMADLVIEMTDDAIKAYETEDLSFIEDFSARDDTIDALRHFDLPGGDHVHDGGSQEHLALHPLHHGRPVSRALRRPCLQDCGECALPANRRTHRNTLKIRCILENPMNT